MLAFFLFDWLSLAFRVGVAGAILFIVVFLFLVSQGLLSKPAAPKVPGHIIAGSTVRIEDGGSKWAMKLLHPCQFQVRVYDGQDVLIHDWECKETKKWRTDWKCPAGFAGKRAVFSCTNECPVSKWDTKPSERVERTVEEA